MRSWKEVVWILIGLIKARDKLKTWYLISVVFMVLAR